MAKLLGESLNRLSGLQRLELDDNEVTKEGFEAIAVGAPASLQEFRMDGNNVTDLEHAKNLPWDSLKVFSMCANGLLDKSGQQLASCFEHSNYPVRVIKLDRNELDYTGAKAIMEKALELDNLTQLRLTKNPIDEDLRESLDDLVKKAAKVDKDILM